MASEPEESYIAVDVAILEALRELIWTADYDRHTLPTLRAVLRVAAIDPHGRVVIGVRMVRDLDQDPAEPPPEQ
jgi:hypothetical protein